MWYEIGVGIVLAAGLFGLQIRMSGKVNRMTEEMHDFIKQKAELEQKHKASECRRIIDHLQNMEQVEINFKDFLTNYKIGDPTNEALKFYVKLAFRPFAYNIDKMKDAVGQLQGKLNDNSLREQFLDYTGWFYQFPKRILENNQPQQEQERKGLLIDIDKQLEKIQSFIDRFSKETEEAKPAKSNAEETKITSKYFPSPKL